MKKEGATAACNTEIVVDDELSALIPPLTDDEFAQLELNLVADGCREPLVIWDGGPPDGSCKYCDAEGQFQRSDDHDPAQSYWTCQSCDHTPFRFPFILLDGHNRHHICLERGLNFEVEEIVLADRNAAKAWIIHNQLGRRNVPPFVRSELVLQLEDVIKDQGKAAMRAGGGSGPSGRQKSAHPEKTRSKLARKAGVSHNTIDKTKLLLQKADEETKQRLRRGESSINSEHTKLKRAEKEANREARRAENREKVATAPDPIDAGTKFATIVIDPPWDWGDEGDKDQLGRARPTYETMPIERIAKLPVNVLADDDCHLFLWITNRSLPKGFDLITMWGFRYVTCITWCKPTFGMGNYFRGSTEHVLFAVKGSQPIKRKNVGTWFRAKRPCGHSIKPAEFFELVESCSPSPYLEMFARKERKGWTAWGAEV